MEPLANGADLAPQRNYLTKNAQSFLRYPWLAVRVAANAKNPKRFLSDMLIESLQMVVNVPIRIEREPPHGLLELILPSLASEVGRVQHEPVATSGAGHHLMAGESRMWPQQHNDLVRIDSAVEFAHHYALVNMRPPAKTSSYVVNARLSEQG